MLTILVTSDLMFSSTLHGAALQSGSEFQITSPTRGIENLAELSPTVVLIDLAGAGLELEPLVQQIREQSPATKIVAYGPHVHEQKLAHAEEVGCDQVLTRGQMHKTAVAVLRSYEDASA